jgi:large subunit ribosomal protein L9
MEVILREDVTGLGIIGEVVKVKPGYARNYLLPRGLAVAADRRNLKQLEHHRRIIDAKKLRERGTVERIVAAMDGLVLETEQRAGRKGKLFGSVTNMEIKRLLDEKEFAIDRRRIELKEPIREIGEHEVLVRVGQELTAKIKIVVKPIGGELEDASVDGDDEEHEERPLVAAEGDSEGSSEQAGEEGESADDSGDSESADADSATEADKTDETEAEKKS